MTNKESFQPTEESPVQSATGRTSCSSSITYVLLWLSS
jgi:hypothetical protein